MKPRAKSIRGWRRDRDYWLVREMRPGDASDHFWIGDLNCMGFVCGGKVYAREIEHAKAYDEANGREGHE